MAVGLQYNHNISFIATQCKIMAIVFYITNYATKVKDLVWKQVVVAAELFRDLNKLTTKYQVKIIETVNSCKKGNDI